MLKVRTKLLLCYLFVVILLLGGSIALYLKHFGLAWFVFFFPAFFLRSFFNPLPKAHKQIYNYFYAKVILVIFAVIAIGIATINILGCFVKNSPTLNKINNYSFLIVLAILIPVHALIIREEIKSANNAYRKINNLM